MQDSQAAEVARKHAGSQAGGNGYFAFGLQVLSELPLPELTPCPNDMAGAPRVTVRLGSAGDDIPNAIRLSRRTQIAPSDFLMTIPDVARYRVRNGSDIVVEPAAGSSPRNVRLYLLGSAFGALCHQCGLLPLHASAIEVGGHCIAFAGQSGMGKSTLAAFFHDRGYRVLCDDICVVSVGAGAKPLAWPGVPRLKLWKEAVHALGRNHANLEPDHDGVEKFHVRVEQPASLEAFPLGRIYGLQRSTVPALITKLGGSAALDVILSNTYRANFLRPMGKLKEHFGHCALISGQVPVYLVRQDRELDSLAQRMASLEQHFLAHDG